MTFSVEVAIVHDYLTQRGGAERVVLTMLRAFPGAPLYTSVFDPGATFSEFRNEDVRCLWTDKLGALRADHRRGLPLYPLVFSSTHIDAKVVVCSSSGFAHGVRATGRKIVYCHNPARWLYTEAPTYLAGWTAMILSAMRVGGPALRAWDRRAMAGAHRVLVNSTTVAKRVDSTYGIEAEVLPPPAGLCLDDARRPIAGIEPGFILSVGRLLAYKNDDALVSGIAQVPGGRLVVAGDGPERSRLEALAGTMVSFVGEVNDSELRWLYANCAGVVSAAREDYGLTPLEAAVYGKPVAALRFGGFLDTVVEGITGVFFAAPTCTKVATAIACLLSEQWDAARIAEHAATFGEEVFIARLRQIVADEAKASALGVDERVAL